MDETTTGRDPAAEDRKIEAAVLQLLLALHPAQLSFAELVRAMSAGGPADFAATDPVDRAVRELSAAGLVHPGDGTVRPTRAALRFHELLG